MKTLPPDRLRKGTRVDLVILAKRCMVLEACGVRMPR